MSTVTLYHNPKCSKSRAALLALQSHGDELEIIEYLKQPLSLTELKELQKKLKCPAKEMIRTKEQLFISLGLAEKLTDDTLLLEAIAEHPSLMQRPIAVKGQLAVIARSADQIEKIF